ncbi:polyhydroxyalkanoic acid system family protein [Marinicella litoralis]|uniref:Putative polyhydroxyalkanoate system protein n=1 Tax=Marinicella litoralis TaxID=644220 RepID=A0A4R6XAV1_9GAMM|nr:polyhydroxyalkanoic acid system family protein [Marinicella litoralis]TDR16276.1 putative polyhydroxyalkanoate system protein [Marinicella litoralis]
MSEINITYPLECHIDHSKQTLQTMLNALRDKYAIQHEFVTETECRLSGSGVTGNLLIKDDGIEIYAKLGFFMIPFKSVIENEINNKLDECFDT